MTHGGGGEGTVGYRRSCSARLATWAGTSCTCSCRALDSQERARMAAEAEDQFTPAEDLQTRRRLLTASGRHGHPPTSRVQMPDEETHGRTLTFDSHGGDSIGARAIGAQAIGARRSKPRASAASQSELWPSELSRLATLALGRLRDHRPTGDPRARLGVVQIDDSASAGCTSGNWWSMTDDSGKRCYALVSAPA